jgi:hypothetical protein
MLKSSGMKQICPESSNNNIWSLKMVVTDVIIVENHSTTLEGKLEFLKPN